VAGGWLDELATANDQQNAIKQEKAVYVRQQTEGSLKAPYLRT
jgi:hypothetical protein